MKKLLICIAFYFKKNRYEYLKKNLINFLNFYDVNVSIIVDTNKEESFNLINKDFPHEINKKIKVLVNKDLNLVPKPIICTKEGFDKLTKSEWRLTWLHRFHILEKINDYDFFMYIEDDIFLPFDNYKNYFDNFYNLWPNYIPSFIRIEEKDGFLYNTDAFFSTKILKKDIIKIKDKNFVKLDNPYHAFWIMPQKELKESINKNFTYVFPNICMREIAASYGLKPGTCPYAYWPSNDVQKIGLVELDSDNKISKKCYSFHLPNNYIDNYQVKFGKLKLDKILKIKFDKIHI